MKGLGMSTEEKLGIGIALGFIIGLFVLAACWTDRNLDFWLTHFKGEEVNCPWYLSATVTLVGNGFVLILNVIGEIARFLV